MITQHPLWGSKDYSQRWRRGWDHWIHRDVEAVDTRRYSIELTTNYAEVKAFIEQEHYSGTLPAVKSLYEMREGNELVGALALTVPVNLDTLTSVFPDLVPLEQSRVLGRLVLSTKVGYNGESWFVTRVWDLAYQEGVRGVVSFSDPYAYTTADGHQLSPGHWGTTYQSLGFKYVDRTRQRRATLLPNGRTLHPRTRQKIVKGERGHAYAEASLVALDARPRRAGEDGAAWLNEVLPAIGARVVQLPGKFCYAAPLGKQHERSLVKIGKPILPYPKRDEPFSENWGGQYTEVLQLSGKFVEIRPFLGNNM